MSCSTSVLSARGCEHLALRGEHAQCAGDAIVARLVARRDVARKREHDPARDHRARGTHDERNRIAREAREHAAECRADQGAAALQPSHCGDRSAELVRRTNVREIRLPPEHPSCVPQTESDRREAQRERLGRDAENREAAQEQREPSEQHGLVAEASHEHSGRHVEQQYADAAQTHDQGRECSASAELEHVQR